MFLNILQILKFVLCTLCMSHVTDSKKVSLCSSNFYSNHMEWYQSLYLHADFTYICKDNIAHFNNLLLLFSIVVT